MKTVVSAKYGTLTRVRLDFQNLTKGQKIAFYRDDLDEVSIFAQSKNNKNYQIITNRDGKWIDNGEVSQTFVKVAMEVSNRNYDGEDVGYYLLVDYNTTEIENLV